jgi:serine/threonine-protein kinase HipA
MTAFLKVLLGERPIGTINLLGGDLSLFVFEDEYVTDPARPTLSQFYRTASGEIRSDTRPTRRKLPPWFSNLLPEGRLRDYLAERGGIHPSREFQLLGLLGEDLPGAVRAVLHDPGMPAPEPKPKLEKPENAPLRFSLAGVQLKFSALLRPGGLTIPSSGMGGDWIVKLPSANFPAVPENEATMLTLAAVAGIPVPEHRLVRIDSIEGLPDLGALSGNKALAVRRFDRSPEGRIHMEDLAQAFGVSPEDKYQKVGFARIAETIAVVMGQPAAQDFIARLVFTILTGNGDMHLKNWSLLYPDGKTPVLAPAYDLVSTIPYIPGDGLALNFLGNKDFASATRERFRKFAQKAGLSEHQTLSTVARVTESVKEVWHEHRLNSELPPDIADRIEAHLFKFLSK